MDVVFSKNTFNGVFHFFNCGGDRVRDQESKRVGERERERERERAREQESEAERK